MSRCCITVLRDAICLTGFSKSWHCQKEGGGLTDLFIDLQYSKSTERWPSQVSWQVQFNVSYVLLVPSFPSPCLSGLLFPVVPKLGSQFWQCPESALGTTNRLIKIKGSPRAVKSALCLVQQKIQEERARSGRNWEDASYPTLTSLVLLFDLTFLPS